MFEAGEAYEKILAADLQRLIDFLKFAEAKNAALLTLSSAWVLASINLESSGHSLPKPFVYAVPIALILALCAAMLAAVSFIPKLKMPPFLGGKRAGPHLKSLLYFGDIASMTAKDLESHMLARYYPNQSEQRREYIHDLIVQISVNSSITLRKMRLFSWGVGLVIAAGVSLMWPSAIMLYTAFKGTV